MSANEQGSPFILLYYRARTRIHTRAYTRTRVHTHMRGNTSSPPVPKPLYNICCMNSPLPSPLVKVGDASRSDEVFYPRSVRSISRPLGVYRFAVGKISRSQNISRSVRSISRPLGHIALPQAKYRVRQNISRPDRGISLRFR